MVFFVKSRVNFNQRQSYIQKSYRQFAQKSYVLAREYNPQNTKNICRCRAELPAADRVVKLFMDRNLIDLMKEVKCVEFKSNNFNSPDNCALADAIQKISIFGLNSFSDVIYVGHHYVMLNALKPIPEQELGDWTGDHGKQLAMFLKDCLVRRVMSDQIGSVIDVGGQNISTVTLVSSMFKRQEDLSCLVVDINSVTPAISLQKKNISYVIDNALNFFKPENYKLYINKILVEKPVLIIFNNFLNVLKAEDGWKALDIAWERLREGDYLVISGLVPEQLERAGFKKRNEVDNIIEFYGNKGFYKSALKTHFHESLSSRLKNSSVLREECFNFKIKTIRSLSIEVTGRRLLVFKQIVK